MSKIDKNKCEAFVDVFVAMTKIAKELTNDEVEYIKAFCCKKIGELKVKELEKKNVL